jgi:hypothetical protein
VRDNSFRKHATLARIEEDRPQWRSFQELHRKSRFPICAAQLNITSKSSASGLPCKCPLEITRSWSAMALRFTCSWMTSGVIHPPVCIFTEDLDELHAELQQRGAHLSQGIIRKPWGNRDFRVSDQSGNEIKFTEPLSGDK